MNLQLYKENGQTVRLIENIAGGKVHVPKMEVLGIDYLAVVDTEDNAFGIWQTNESAS